MAEFDDDDDDDRALKDRVLRLTHRALLDDAARFTDFTPPMSQYRGAVFEIERPRRFSTYAGIEEARWRIRNECFEARADEHLVEYLSTRWLARFEPLPT